jgi:pullulanase
MRLARLRVSSESLAGDDVDFIHLDFNGNKRVLVWRRGATNSRHPVVVIANFSDFTSEQIGTPHGEYVVPNWPPTPPGGQWKEVTQDRFVPPEWVGREPIVSWEAKVYTVI